MNIKQLLFQPICILPLAYLRVVFGAVMLWEVWRSFQYDRIFYYYIDPNYFFPYPGFEWVKPWPGDGMYFHFIVMGILAIFIIIGFLYRLSMLLYFLGFTYVFLLDETHYLNHFYFVCLLCWLMIFVPAHRAYSADALLRPKLRTDLIPAWPVWVFRWQIGIVYFFGGIAKVNGDWLRGEPMRMWLADRTDFPVIGQWFTEEWMVMVFSYGGLWIDLLAPPFLLWRRTRYVMMAFLITFHLTNYQLFNIGIFPWLMLATLPIYLSFDQWHTNTPDMPAIVPGSRVYRLMMGLMCLWFAVQVMLPLRHWLIPGDVAWTEEGHRFSWRMKLRDKESDLRMFVTHQATDTRWEVDLPLYLTYEQIDEMSSRPYMIQQFAKYLQGLSGEGYTVTAWSVVSLNGRNPQVMLDPSVDLAAVKPKWFGRNEWIFPLADG